MSRKMTRAEFMQWARTRTQYTENEMLSPHNPNIADNEEVEVMLWEDFVNIVFELRESFIEVVEEKKYTLEIPYQDIGINPPAHYLFTEQEIKDIDERLWSFAKEVNVD